MPSATLSHPVWQRLVRFEAVDGLEYCGEPVDPDLDVGIAMVEGKPILVKVLDASSALDSDARFTGEVKEAKRILTPLTPSEVGTIRCVGLNYKDHAVSLQRVSGR